MDAAGPAPSGAERRYPLRCAASLFPGDHKGYADKAAQEEVGFVLREETEGYPRNVAYRLTDVGHEFLHVFNKVEAWCEIYLADKAERKAHAAALAE